MRQLNCVNFSSRNNARISLLVMHYTGMQSAEAAISRLCDAQAKVSAHYVVGEDGGICQLVDEEYNAWHAGFSFWRGHRNVNDISVGIEIVNPGHEWGYRPFPKIQMEAVAELSKGIIARHGIKPCDVVAHSDIAPARKQDPGELFDWSWLAQQKVGVWPHYKGEAGQGSAFKPGDSGEKVKTLQADLARYGYDIPQNGQFDEATHKVAIAFQRHFRPQNLSGNWDAECQGLLAALLGML